MRIATIGALILMSAIGHAEEYFTCSRQLEADKTIRYIFSTDGKMAQERLVFTDEDRVEGVMNGLEVKSVAGSQDHYELVADLPDGETTVNLVVDKDAQGKYIASYTRTRRSHADSGTADCRRSPAIDRHQNDPNFMIVGPLPKGSLLCTGNSGGERKVFAFTFWNKRVWSDAMQTPSGQYFAEEHFVVSHEKNGNDQYNVISKLRGFGSWDTFQIKLKLDQASQKWKFQFTNLDRNQSGSGSCEDLQ